jgi:hypothetical protein
MKWTLRLLCPWHLFLPLHLRASGWTHGLFLIWFSRLVVPFCLAMTGTSCSPGSHSSASGILSYL